MKNWFIHILLLASTLGMLTTSCSQEEGLEPQASEEKAQVVFTIDLGSSATNSRGVWNDNYAAAIGSEFDNFINPEQFYVKIAVGSNTYPIENIGYRKTGECIYEFTGEVKVSITDTEAKIFVYANMDPDDNGSFDNATFNRDAAYIPMWGVQTVELTLVPGLRVVLDEPIYLLRAMAKVEINMEAEGYTLTNVSLNRYNSTGYCLPGGAGSVDNTKLLHYDNDNPKSFNPCTTTPGENLNFSVSNNQLVFYLPEVANGTNDNELKMTLTLTRGTESVTLQAPYLYFRQYTNGKAEGANPLDVVRNHWYRYTITAVNTSKPIDGFEITYMVTDWNEVTDLDLDFGYDSGDAFGEGLPTPYDPNITEKENGNTGNEGDDSPEQ